MSGVGVALIIATVSAGVAVAGAYHVWRAFAGRQWWRADGHIVATQVREHWRGVWGHRYAGLVTYQYVVNGRQFRGDRVRFGFCESNHSVLPIRESIVDQLGAAQAAGALDATFPPGRPVTVYYNPSDPWDSTLETRADATAWPTLVSGLIGVLAAAVRFIAT